MCDDSLITFWKRNGPPRSLAGREGRCLVLMEAPVVMVGSDVVEVERRLRAGELSCPCGGGLARGDMPARGRSAVSACCARAAPGAARAW